MRKTSKDGLHQDFYILVEPLSSTSYFKITVTVSKQDSSYSDLWLWIVMGLIFGGIGLFFLGFGVILLWAGLSVKREEYKRGIATDPSFNMVAKMKSYANHKTNHTRFKLKSERKVLDKRTKINEPQKKKEVDVEPHIPAHAQKIIDDLKKRLAESNYYC